MQLDLNNLPTDTALLHRLVRDIVGSIEHRDGEIERLKSIIKQLQRAQFGRRSERLDPDQLAVGLEDLEGDLARERENRPRVEKQPTERSPHRKPLPNHLPREDVRLDIGNISPRRHKSLHPQRHHGLPIFTSASAMSRAMPAAFARSSAIAPRAAPSASGVVDQHRKAEAEQPRRSPEVPSFISFCSHIHIYRAELSCGQPTRWIRRSARVDT
jgi:hypothetical protein